MRITGLETITCAAFPNYLWVRVLTDEGLIGLGETMFEPESVAACIHGHVARHLLGRSPLEIDRHSTQLMLGYGGFASHGAEMRAASAIDVALWDILGQLTGQPIYQLLGGASRDKVRVYNTCAGYAYFRPVSRRGLADWAVQGQAAGPYEDLEAFQHRADELAHDLLAEGYGAMKIWPFDVFAHAGEGHHIGLEDLKRGLEPFEKIRRAVGDRIEVMLEMHSLWTLPAATRIARAVEAYAPFWLEDPMRMNNFMALAELARSTPVPITASETMATRWSFRELMAQGAARYIMFDVGWVGGLSEAKKVATMAEAHHLPVAPHDCTGPVVWTASCHLTTNLTNAVFQECVRAYFSGWYREVVTELPAVRDGFVTCPPGAGLGTRLSDDFLGREDVTVRATHAKDQ